MALSEQDVQSIVTRYDRGNGESVPVLAEAFGVSGTSIRYHLNKHKVLGADGPTPETAEDLGIDQEDGASAGLDFAAIMNDPRFAKLIDAAVAARMVQVGGTQAPAAGGSEMKILADSIKHMLDVSAMQQPGYVKPLPVEEIDRRAAGYVEMVALLAEYKTAGTPPTYILGEEGFHGPSPNGPTLYEPGSEVDSYLPPAESFKPINEQAFKVHGAMMQWIGGPSPEIGDRLVEAHADAKRVVIGGEASAGPVSAVNLRSAPKPENSGDALKRHPMAHMLTENPNNIPAIPGARHTNTPRGPAFAG